MTTKQVLGKREGTPGTGGNEAQAETTWRCWHATRWVVDLRSGRVVRETCAECREEAAETDGGGDERW